ncbi:uncharacterized protein ARMOST_04310 [Armillaria ostoyae]|uniref:Peptidase C14 caspase domain-containing protein n=1 Tax=Armillaria ostoyae TaxID=47428 RepID=A0A284QX07_ARMOS|nr:uncharacterized protein ARMOST_04310 [Armillaria ostoyae]
MPGNAINSVAVLEEARRRATVTGAPLRPAENAKGAGDDVENLEKLYDLHFEHHEYCATPFLNQNAVDSVDASRFWAILIGIDAYQENPLRGCVSDALLMESFLTNDLGMPEGRIQCLLGPNNPGDPKSTPTASRANIVDTLYSLVHNPEIDRDDNIVIYYAGHGSTYCCPERPHAVQCCSGLCPIKALCPLDRDTQDADGKWIPNISDREINNLFKCISLAKGNKITFIADCCYGGSSSRGLGERSMRTTENASLHDMLHAADERWKHSSNPSKYHSVLSKDWKPHMGSHVVLMACKNFETAKEEQGHNGFCGVFTWALVHALRLSDWKKKTTYVDLVELLDRSLSGQTPLVTGKLKRKRLFYQTA